MALHYYKRFRMERDLSRSPLPDVLLPQSFHWEEWQPHDLERHALVKYRSFCEELDSHVFPCLSDYYGCLRLMREISQQPSFLPAATWLLCHHNDHEPDNPDHSPEDLAANDVGTIQGLIVSQELGSIQNVGIVPEYRGQGLGRLLVLQALQGFQRAGCQRVTLEVTSSNVAAVELYRQLGFRVARTMYRQVIWEEMLS